MSYLKPCKYCHTTPIQWDTELNAFRESDGRLHDRKRCEGLRGISGSGSSTTTTDSRQQQQSQQKQSGVASYEVASDLHQIKAAIAELDSTMKGIKKAVDAVYFSLKQNQQMADSEANYDQDKEDGLV